MDEKVMEEERRKIRVLVEEEAVKALKAHMASEDIKETREQGWHVGREIPLAVIFFLIVQTGSIIWWAASTSAQLNSQRDALTIAQQAQSAVDKRQDDSAQREEARLTAQLDNLNTKMDRVIEHISK